MRPGIAGTVSWHNARVELEAAIFDLGGVLTTPILDSFLAYESSLGLPEHTFARLFSYQSQPDGEPDFFRLEKGLITEAEYFSGLARHVERELGAPVGLPADPAEVRRGLWDLVRRNEPMISAAVAISRHYKVGLLTNNVREWGDWRDHYPLDAFDAIVDSSEVGLRKPDPAIFRMMCTRLDVDPGKAAFVDDFLTNVEAARNLGMAAILFTTTGEVLERLRPFFPKAFVSPPAAILEQ